ncbi:MAG TPA: extracellular solute-binding protein [Tepidisphaeraceae bacterium]|jgi:multiple sugar transport system permease protein|nr:extracellular solute-binding protein [Tepidisphaeraceae bacterium]
MTIARLARSFLAVVAAAIVVWSFYDVGRRAWNNHRDDRPITLTVLHWGAPSEDQIVADIVKAYQREHPNVRIIRINPGDADTTRNKLLTMLAAGQPPDVFYLPPDLLPELANLKIIRSLEPFVAKENKAWMNDFVPVVLNAFRFDTATGTMGRGPLYALPKDFTTTGFYININLFDAAGIDWRSIQKHGWTWSQFAMDMRKINALRDRPEFKGRRIYGTYLWLWSDTIRDILWTFGGEFFHTDLNGHPLFRQVALNTPESQAGLKFIRWMRLDEQTCYNPTGMARDGSQEFINGDIGCVGPVGTWLAPTYKTITAFKWDVVPAPYAKAPASIIFLTGWTMSSACREPQAAYQLIHFLCGKEGQLLAAKAGLAMPSRRSAMATFLNPPPPDNPHEVPIPPYHRQVFVDAIAHARIQQLPEQTEWGQIVTDNLNRSIQLGLESTEQAAKDVQRRWLYELDSPTRSTQRGLMPWKKIILFTIAVLAAAVGLLWLKARKEKLGTLDAAQERAGWMFIMPWLAGFLALTLGPMVLSFLLAFTRWAGLTPLGDAAYVGTANFKELFTHDVTFPISLKVTTYYVLLAVPVTQLAGLAVALLMNMRVRGIAVFRTIYFVPSVVSGVALAVLWLQVFNNEYGIINQFLRPLLHPMHLSPPNWFGMDIATNPPTNDAKRWAVPALTIMSLWGVGAGMIIYLAGLKGIPESLYEAARLDGAGPARRLWNVTLPMLSPLIFYNVVMGIIGSFQIFTQVYVMTGSDTSSRGGPDNATLFYVLSLYREAFEFHHMGYASAMAWVLFVIVLVVTLLIFRGSRNVVYYEGLKT